MKNFGKLAKDKVTGFQGIITSKHYYLYGCVQYGLMPTVDKDGKKQQSEYFDEGRIEIIGNGINPKEVKSDKNGCEFQEHPNE